MLFLEPVVLFLCIYFAFVYGVIFLVLLIIPLTNTTRRDATPLMANLLLLSISVGILLYLPFVPHANRLYRAHLCPETRLYLVIAAAVAQPRTIFWWGWTDPFPRVPWIIPTSAGVPFGMALLAIYMGVTEYLVDVYDSVGWGASVMAAGGVLRASFAGCFPLFGRGR
jgi:MFS transporter, DHA1 family, multidrug resistance protein